MQKPRRKKILLTISIILLIAAGTAYFFRYTLILKLQYSRLQSLNCGKTDCLDRIWVHRVNSLERYDLLKGKFHGFETDIVYVDSLRSFSVYHPPQAPGEDTLTLDRFFAHCMQADKHFWLDMRFVGEANMQAALKVFSKLDQQFGLKSNCIIELYDLSAARLFAINGYTVSFNISEDLISRMEIEKHLPDSISREWSSIRYISQDARYLPAVKRLLPGKKIITWHPRFTNFINTEELQKLLDDPQVEIVLVNIKSRFYR
jgi:hypothetical protein